MKNEIITYNTLLKYKIELMNNPEFYKDCHYKCVERVLKKLRENILKQAKKEEL